jgi:HK97 family phage major capsid protein
MPAAVLASKKALRTTEDVRTEMAYAEATAQTYYDKADKEERELTADEFETVRQTLAYHKELREDYMPVAQEFESVVKQNALQIRGESNRLAPAATGSDLAVVGNQSYHTSSAPVPRSPCPINTTLQAFRADRFSGGAAEAEQAAMDAGQWMKAYFFGSRDAVNYCKKRDYLHLDRYDQALDAQTVDDSAKGGLLVPTVVSKTILDLRDRVGIIAAEARRYSMQSEIDLVNKRASGLTVYKPGEDTAITTSEKTWAGVTLTANDAYTLTYISHKLMRGAVVSAVDQVVSEIAYAFAAQQDYEGINGTGGAPAPDFGITGVVPSLTSTDTTLLTGDWTTADAAAITELIGLLPNRYHDRAIFVCSRSFWAQQIEPLLESRGASKSDISADSPRSLKGYRVAFTDEMPSATALDQTCLLFGSFYDGILLGERESVGIATSTDHRFNFDQLAVRGRIAYDIQVHEPGDGATVTGSIVGMVTSAT